MLELKILIDDIDYNSVTELLVPLLAEKLEKDGKGGILGNVLAGNTNMAVSMARTLLNTMPQEKKDELVVQLVTKNRDKLLQKGGELAAKNGVRLRLCDFTRCTYFFRACTAARRASTFSCVVAQLAQNRTPEWVSSTRSQYS